MLEVCKKWSYHVTNSNKYDVEILLVLVKKKPIKPKQNYVMIINTEIQTD